MSSLKDVIKAIESQLDMSPEALEDFKIAADHNIQCTCRRCRKYWEIMKME